jgi:predicted acylesterase/phospholipase RssA
MASPRVVVGTAMGVAVGAGIVVGMAMHLMEVWLFGSRGI